MNPQQKIVLYVFGAVASLVALWVAFSTPDDPRHDDWRTYFGSMGEARDIDNLIKGADAECDRWDQELTARYARARVENLPGAFTTTNTDLAERFNQHKRLLEELKKAHAKEQQQLLAEVEKCRKEYEDKPGSSEFEEKDLKEKAEARLNSLYDELVDDSRKFNEELSGIQTLLRKGKVRYGKDAEGFDYQEWLENEISHLNPRANMRQKRADILRAKKIIEEHKVERGGELNSDWEDLLFKLCGGESGKGGVLDRIDSCRSTQDKLRDGIMMAINRNIAMWMPYDEIPQTPKFPVKADSLKDTDANVKLQRVRKALEDQNFKLTPYSYQAHDLDVEAKKYCTLQLQPREEPPFLIEKADYVFRSTEESEDYQNILLEILKKWAMKRGGFGLSAESVVSDLFQGNHYVEVTFAGNSRGDKKVLRFIVCNKKSWKKIGKTVDLYFGPSKLGKDSLVAYDALVFFSDKQGVILQEKAFPRNHRHYTMSAQEAVRVLVGHNAMLKFLEARGGDTVGDDAPQGADTIRMCSYHNVIGSEDRARLTPMSNDDSITIRIKGSNDAEVTRFFEPTEDNIRMGYYPLTYRLYVSTPDKEPSRHIKLFLDFMCSNEEGEGQLAFKSSGLVGLFPSPYAPRALTDQNIEIKKVIQALKKLDKEAFGYSDADTEIVGVMMGYRALFKTNESDEASGTLKDSLQTFVEDEKGANFQEMRESILGDIMQYTTNFTGACCVLFVGHADSTGQEAWNETLSDQRSITCMNLIKGNSNIPCYSEDGAKKTIPCINFGSGSRMPVGSDMTEEGKKMNRRAEVFLIWRKGIRTYKN